MNATYHTLVLEQATDQTQGHFKVKHSVSNV